MSRAPGNEGYRQHLLLALEQKADRSAPMDELKALLVSESSSVSMDRVGELLKSVRSAKR